MIRTNENYLRKNEGIILPIMNNTPIPITPINIITSNDVKFKYRKVRFLCYNESDKNEDSIKEVPNV